MTANTINGSGQIRDYDQLLHPVKIGLEETIQNDPRFSIDRIQNGYDDSPEYYYFSVELVPTGLPTAFSSAEDKQFMSEIACIADTGTNFCDLHFAFYCDIPDSRARNKSGVPITQNMIEQYGLSYDLKEEGGMTANSNYHWLKSEIIDWIGENIAGKVRFDDWNLVFQETVEETLFKLRWS